MCGCSRVVLVDQVAAHLTGPLPFPVTVQTDVFRSLLTYWVDFTDFAGDTPYRCLCFDELREKKAKQEEAVRRRAEAQQEEVERQLCMQPRYETPEERQKRLARRKEEKEMGGRIAISFSLCEPERAFRTAQTQTGPSTPIPMEEYSRGMSPQKHNGRGLSAPPLNRTSSRPTSRHMTDASRPVSTLSSIAGQSDLPMTPEVPTRGGSPSNSRSQSQSQMGMGTPDSPLFMTQLQWHSPKRRSSLPAQCEGLANRKTSRRGSKVGQRQPELTLLVETAVLGGGEVEVRSSDDGHSKLMNWKLSSPNQKVLFGSGIQTSSVLTCTEEAVH